MELNGCTVSDGFGDRIWTSVKYLVLAVFDQSSSRSVVGDKHRYNSSKQHFHTRSV